MMMTDLYTFIGSQVSMSVPASILLAASSVKYGRHFGRDIDLPMVMAYRAKQIQANDS